MRMLAAFLLSMLCASPAAAQRFEFTRSLPVGEGALVEVVTDNGAVEVRGGTRGRVSVAGTVTVRLGLAVPADAVAIARRVASAPPVEATDARVRLGVPADAEARRAVTVSYRIEVPPTARLTIRTSSGAISVRGVPGASSIESGSGAIDVARVGDVSVTAQSSGVRVEGAAATEVRTQSGAVEVTEVTGALSIETGSGRIQAAVRQADASPGAVRIRSRSGEVSLTGVRGALEASTDSARIAIEGSPGSAWEVTSGSGEIAITARRGAGFLLDADSDSGRVHAPDTPSGDDRPHRLRVPIGTPGPTVRVHTRSSTIRVTRQD